MAKATNNNNKSTTNIAYIAKKRNNKKANTNTNKKNGFKIANVKTRLCDCGTAFFRTKQGERERERLIWEFHALAPIWSFIWYTYRILYFYYGVYFLQKFFKT